MRLTKPHLKQIIKEELQHILTEQESFPLYNHEPNEKDLIKKFEERWDGEDPFDWFGLYHMINNYPQMTEAMELDQDDLEKLQRGYAAAKHSMAQMSFETLTTFEERINDIASDNPNDDFLNSVYRDLDEIYAAKGAKRPTPSPKPRKPTHVLAVGPKGNQYRKNTKTGCYSPFAPINFWTIRQANRWNEKNKEGKCRKIDY